MPCSPAQLEANRRNAARSKGPKTAEGKQRSRGNALKHGMTGAGVVLSDEDAGEVATLAGELEAEMKPSGNLGRILVHRVAVMAVRLDKCSRYDEVATAKRVRDAEADQDEARFAEVEALAATIDTAPAASVRGLMRSRAGIDRLTRMWLVLKGILDPTASEPWRAAHRERVNHLLGFSDEEASLSPADALARAILGDFSGLPNGWGGMDAAERKRGARVQVVALIDAEVGALEALGDDLEESEAIDRAEAPERALFDSSKQGELTRRYEAAAERTLFRTLREFRQVEQEAQAEPVPEEKTNPIEPPSRGERTADDPVDWAATGAFADAGTPDRPVAGVVTLPVAAPLRL